MAGWTWAMSLAQLAPDRTAPLLARGRAIGDSRVVCGVHNESAVDAARVAATAVMVCAVRQSEWQAVCACSAKRAWPLCAPLPRGRSQDVRRRIGVDRHSRRMKQ